MAKLNIKPVTGTIAGVSLPDPPDPDSLRQKQLLDEAMLRSISVSPNPAPPFGRVEVEWDVKMPVTVLPSVKVELHLHVGTQDSIVGAKGSLTTEPKDETVFVLFLRTPLATRQLAAVPLTMDFAACKAPEIPSSLFHSALPGQASSLFPPGGEVMLRDDGLKLDIGIDSFVLEIPLEIEVPNWFNANVDLTLGFSVSGGANKVIVSYGFGKSKVGFGWLSGILSIGISAAVAFALEKMSDAYLDAIVGSAIGERLARVLTEPLREILESLNEDNPNPFKLQGVSLDQDRIKYRLCPTRPVPSTGTHGPVVGGAGTVHL